MEDKEQVWVSFEEAEAHRKLYVEREQELLRSWGLGWLLEFCKQTDRKEDEANI